MKVHPASEIFPLLGGPEFASLVNDIKKHGLLTPIVLLDGKILDGRNRWRACEKLGLRPKTKDWTPPNSTTPTEYVISANLHRRHLTTSQRAAIAAEVEPIFAKEAKDRQRKAGERGKEGGRGKKKNPSPKNGPRVSSECRACKQAAAAMKVSHGLVSEAKRIKDKSPQVFEKIKSGEMTVGAASKKVFPTAQEKAARDPWVRWEKALSEILSMLISVDAIGGIKTIAKKWNEEQTKHYRETLLELSERMREQAEDLC